MKLAILLFAMITYGTVQASSLEFWIERGAMTGDRKTSDDGSLLIVEQDIALSLDNERGTISLDANLWPKGVLVWDIDQAFRNDAELLGGVQEAIRQMSTKTVLKFKRRTSESNYINIVREDGCYSHIGMRGGKQVLSLGNGCTSWHTVAHEFLHAAGFLHEHTRSDRDKSISIDWTNLGPAGVSNFSVLRHKTDGPFDFNSIMLYRSFAYYPFVLRQQDPMWIRLDNRQPQRDDNTDLSALDIKAISDLYRDEVNPIPNPNPNPNDGKLDTKNCQKIDYQNSRSFEGTFTSSVTNMNNYNSYECVSVVFNEEYSLDLIPERINDWLVEIQNTGGEVKRVAVSRSWFREILDMIIKVITGRNPSQLKEQASKMNAYVYYDKESEYILEIKFSPRD